MFADDSRRDTRAESLLRNRALRTPGFVDLVLRAKVPVGAEVTPVAARSCRALARPSGIRSCGVLADRAGIIIRAASRDQSARSDDDRTTRSGASPRRRPAAPGLLPTGRRAARGGTRPAGSHGAARALRSAGLSLDAAALPAGSTGRRRAARGRVTARAVLLEPLPAAVASASDERQTRQPSPERFHFCTPAFSNLNGRTSISLKRSHAFQIRQR